MYTRNISDSHAFFVLSQVLNHGLFVLIFYFDLLLLFFYGFRCLILFFIFLNIRNN